VPTLCKAGYALRILTRRPNAHPWLHQYPNVEIVEGDVCSGAGLEAVAECDYIIHAAGLFSMWSDAGDFEASNVLGTKNLIQAALKARIKRLVYVSTVAVIGNPQPDRILDENHPANPADEYQWSKLKAEEAILCHQSALDALILRPGAFYGPMGDYAFNRLFFTDPMRGIIMQMDGGHYRIFPVYIQDVADAILSALDKGRTGEIYNICGEYLSHRAAFDIICEEAHLHGPRMNIPGFVGINVARLLTALSKFTHREPFWSLNLRSYVFNDWCVVSDKAKRELGFVPTDFREGARRTIAWYHAGKPTMLPELRCEL